MKKSAYEIWKQSQKDKLSDKKTKEIMKLEGIIVPKIQELKNTKKMKQSSIEWLFKHYLPLKKGLELNQPLVVELYKKAKEMHKQEVIDGIVQYQIKHHKILSEQGIINAHNLAEQYYNETYNIKR